MRTARNSQQFIDAVEQRCGVKIEVISGDEEGRLAYIAVKSGMGLAEGSLAIFDTGGGSSQFTFGHGSTVEERFSVNVGAVRYTEKFGLSGVVAPEQLQAALKAIAADLARLDEPADPGRAGGNGRRHHEHRRGQAWPGEVRCQRHSGIGDSNVPRSIARSRCTAQSRWTTGARLSACSPSGQMSFWPGRASSRR